MVLTGSRAALPSRRGWLLAAGATAFAVALGAYVAFALASPPLIRWMSPVDIWVYRAAGLIVRGATPLYGPHKLTMLYHWARNPQFTYTPFAAMVFTIVTLPGFQLLMRISVGVNIAALLATVWMSFGALGYRRSMARLGGTLLLAAALFWTEPVQRTLYLGQVELVLMTLIIWDQCQPDRRWWKGAGIGIAAGIKLVPLIFIPYLLLTRRYRQAGVAAGVFALTVAAGFVVLPGASGTWWLDGLFLQGRRTGFMGWEGNQSLLAIITRLSGSMAAAQPIWLAVAAVTTVAGLACAAMLDQGGQRLAGLLTCALTGLLVSPVSWDHHWVWIVPGVVLAVHYAYRARSAARWARAALAAAIVLIFAAWPGSFWGAPRDLGGFSMGLIWAPPNTNPGAYYQHGDQPSYPEYHWHGLQLIAGNLYVLTGTAIFLLLLVLAVRAKRARARSVRTASRPGPVLEHSGRR